MKHQVDFLEQLQIDYEKYPVIAVVGGGGKTSLIYRLTDELIDKGKRVIITTTTHMAGESELPFARGGDAVRVKELLDKERYVIAAEYEEDTGKYASLTDEKLEELRELCDVMLVEADGAKHHTVSTLTDWLPQTVQPDHTNHNVRTSGDYRLPFLRDFYRMMLCSVRFHKHYIA